MRATEWHHEFSALLDLFGNRDVVFGMTIEAQFLVAAIFQLVP